MVSRIISFLCILLMSKLSIASSDTGKFPELFKYVSLPLLMDHKFEHSCGWLSEGMNDGKVDNYFFFSLSQYLVDKSKKHEYRFYTSKEFSGKPAYVLDKEGLKEGSKVICPWGLPYNEDHLHRNYLSNCTYHVMPYRYSNIHYHLIDYKEDELYSDDSCSVVKVTDYHINEGQYFYRISINNEDYYLDTTDMPDLANGKKFYSYERRLNHSLAQRGVEIEKLIEAFTKYRASSHYSKLKSCFLSKDVDCVSSVWTHKFYEDVATAGYNQICDNRKGCDVKDVPLCGEDFKGFKGVINSVIFSILKDLLEDITFMKTEKYYIRENKIYYRVPNPHRQMNEPVIEIRFDENGMKLVSYNDGLIC